MAFQISSFSGNQGSCVEVDLAYQNTTHPVAVRNSNDRTGPTVLFTDDEWTAFVKGVKNDEFTQGL